MGVQDVIKDSIVKSLSVGNLFISDIVFALSFSSLLGIYIYMIYKFMTKNDLNNQDFNKTLALLPVITASILLAMQSNLVVSLGMVGALSIVRYRSAIKNPLDLAFLFFSISIGIITGTGIYKLAIITTAFFTVMLFLVNLLPNFRSPCLLVVSAEAEASEEEILRVVKKFNCSHRMRNRVLTPQSLELIWEVKTPNESDMVREIIRIAHVLSVNTLAHDGSLRV